MRSNLLLTVENPTITYFERLNLNSDHLEDASVFWGEWVAIGGSASNKTAIGIIRKAGAEDVQFRFIA